MFAKEMGRWKLIVFCLVLWACGAWAQDVLTGRYNMECLDLSTGLPHNHVNQIFTDSQGFLWISTYGGGAVRYDGYSFMKPVISRQSEVSSNSCKGFAEDDFQRLWVAYDEATMVIDLRTMDYVTPVCENGDLDNRLLRPSVKVYCDSKGGMWQLTRDSIFRYTFNKKGYVAHVSCCRYSGNTPDITIADIEKNGTVWVNIENGLYQLTESGDQLIRKEIAPVLKELQGYYVTDLLKRDNTVWISTNNGLYAYDQYNSSLRGYRHSADPHSISHDFSTALAISPEGHLLVGSLRGVNILDESTGTFEHWNTATSNKPMPSDFVHCLLIRNGQIWVGTETAGIVKLSPQPFILRNYVHDAANGASLSPNPVNAMYVESNGTLWVGTVEGGLNRKANDGSFTHWTTQNSQLSHNSVSLLEADAHGRLWIGTWGGGLNVINMAVPGGVQHVVMPPEMTAITNYIGSMAYDKYNDALWIGSNDGVFIYDLKTGTLTDPFEGNREIRGCIGAQVDKEGNLWLGCMSGVYVVDLRSRKHAGGPFSYRHLRQKLDHPESSVVDKICCFCETKDGTLWLGSNGYGLYRRIVDPKSGKERFEVLTTDDGLANNSVKGVVEDVQGRLWITTNNGLSVYDPRARTFNNYFESDGLLSQCFYWNSVVKAPDNALFLGSVDGLTEIRGENEHAHYPVHLTFTRLIVDNQVITVGDGGILDGDISQATRIRLHESNKSMTIEFSTLTYAGATQEHNSYRLKGFEQEWIPLKPGEHSVRYTSLKPGSYTFEVKHVGDADEENAVISIQVSVSPYFWKSWWFLSLLALALAVLMAWIYRKRVEALREEEAEKLLVPIRKVLDESDDPEHLQQHLQNMLDSQLHLQQSVHRSVEADNEDVRRNQTTFMERATAIMEQHYMNSEFGIAEFAEAIGMSRSQLSKKMNEETGQSTGQFIRNYRLGIAKKLLLENVAHRNITEIAYRVGFNDPKYFTRCFTTRFGSSPSSYVEKDGGVDKNSVKKDEK